MFTAKSAIFLASSRIYLSKKLFSMYGHPDHTVLTAISSELAVSTKSLIKRYSYREDDEERSADCKLSF